MMDSHPFTPERRLGHVYQVEGSFADVTFIAANRLPRSHFGEYLGRGEVGEFVVIDVGGIAIFGRLLRVGTPAGRADDLVREPSKKVSVEGRIQLLSTLGLGGRSTRGIAKYPKVGDPVYAASAEAILAVIATSPDSSEASLQLGRLSVDESVAVVIPLSRLFGRHLAVVGATGSGKSWTLGHIAESVATLRGKMILIDATGEFRTLGDRARHVAFGDLSDEPANSTLVGIPHHRMRETDRNAFLTPSSGSQLPKLREAVRSLRLAHAIAQDPDAETVHKQLLGPRGDIVKSGVLMATHHIASAKYASTVESPSGPFNIRLLAHQIQNECVWVPGRSDPRKYGDPDQSALGYVASLVSRVNDLLQTPEIMSVIAPQPGVANILKELSDWVADRNSHVLRISLKNLTFTNHLREIVVNILGQAMLGAARKAEFVKASEAGGC